MGLNLGECSGLCVATEFGITIVTSQRVEAYGMVRHRAAVLIEWKRTVSASL
jgi:hypothetical protein